MPLLRAALPGLPGFCLLSLTIGCGSTREIYTAPPRPATSIEETAVDARRRAALTVVVTTGETPLPEDVLSLRFRVEDVQFREAGGAWSAYPVDAAYFEIGAGRTVRKVVLDTRLPAARYDSLAVSLADVFVQFDANAGAPLTMPHEAPLKMALGLEPAVGTQTTLALTFEPGASLYHDRDCHWFFMPFLTPTLGD